MSIYFWENLPWKRKKFLFFSYLRYKKKRLFIPCNVLNFNWTKFLIIHKYSVQYWKYSWGSKLYSRELKICLHNIVTWRLCTSYLSPAILSSLSLLLVGQKHYCYSFKTSLIVSFPFISAYKYLGIILWYYFTSRATDWEKVSNVVYSCVYEYSAMQRERLLAWTLSIIPKAIEKYSISGTNFAQNILLRRFWLF